MKLLARSRSNPRQLFVPINHFVFETFVVRVQRLTSRQSRAPRPSLSAERGTPKSPALLMGIRSFPIHVALDEKSGGLVQNGCA
jgi:hypothetical protein